MRIYITPETPKEGVPREWSAYSPETLISRYGKPSEVGFFMDWGPRSFFDMVMAFDQVDLIVEYSGYDLIPRKKGSPKVCPLSAQFESVILWMGKEPVHPPDVGVLLEEATSLTMEEFSELMTGNPGKACLIVKGDVFP